MITPSNALPLTPTRYHLPHLSQSLLRIKRKVNIPRTRSPNTRTAKRARRTHRSRSSNAALPAPFTNIDCGARRVRIQSKQRCAR
jgi:hypothetical protein